MQKAMLCTLINITIKKSACLCTSVKTKSTKTNNPFKATRENKWKILTLINPEYNNRIAKAD